MEEKEIEEGEIVETEMEEENIEEGETDEREMGLGKNIIKVESCPSPGSKKRSRESSISEEDQIERKRPYVCSASQELIEELLKMKPYSMTQIPSLTDSPDFATLIAGEDISQNNIIIILKMLHLPMVHETEDKILHLLRTFFGWETFASYLCNFISTLKHSSEEAKVGLPIIMILMEKFLNLAPMEALSKLSTLADVCFSVLYHLKVTNPDEFSHLELAFTKIQTALRAVQSNVDTSLENFLSSMRPSDDYRTRNVLPTCHELLTERRSFLQKNIIKGPYVDSSDYLNIQFCLLREDIIRPLRNGLQHYYKDSKNKNQDVRIYKNVYFHECRIEGKELIYHVTLKLSKRFNADKSRALMFGNVLCFSHDSFETMIIGTVYNRNELKRKSLGVQLVGERRIPINFCELKVPFTMVESKAYFLPYVHTLRAIQKINVVPFKDYIVDVKDQNTPPKYLDKDNSYDFSIMSASSASPLPLFSHSYREKNHLTYKVLSDIDQWPSCELLQLDESQRQALHHALTSQLAIIQGPPGTGKTHVGLQIIKLLLSNIGTWKDFWNLGSPKKGPILVVCYSNHALDQFLEGISEFSQNIVRVGSRSKNEKLARFNINRRSCRYRTLSQSLNDLKFVINKLSLLLKSIRVVGIIALPIFLDFNVIDHDFVKQLNADNLTVSDYLLNTNIYGGACNEWETLDVIRKVIVNVMSQMTQNASQGISQNENSEGITTDINKDFFIEEQNKRIIFDDLDELSANIQTDQCFEEDVFELSESLLKVEHNNLKKKCNEQPYSYQHYAVLTELEKKLGNLYWGLTIVHNKEECIFLERTQDIYSLNVTQRWKLYNYWKKKLICNAKERKLSMEDKYIIEVNNLESLQMEDRIDIMRRASVVGMTTTAAAQYCDALQKVAPTIVVVEEAAEILETHVVSSLSEACEHLILIGDHQQLKPKTNVFQLAKKFHLDVSLFERLINNGIKYTRLDTQHRMKPCISNLLIPTIYPDLKDHELVSQYPKIRGIEKDLFFLDHTHRENKLRDEDGSVENIFEAKFAIALCSYLHFQGYSTNDVTLLTPYSGQCRLLRKMQNENPKCFGFRISILDDYQGEESNIIILSLVRSNDNGTAGFLSSNNRTCVAISRAKYGFYVIGNMSLFAKASQLWAKIRDKLVEKGNIGPQLTLVCQNHPEEVIAVASAEDIIKNRPRGVCNLMCNIPLPRCKHKCPQTCHSLDSDHHMTLKCTMKCQRNICELNHPCPDLCCQICSPCKIHVLTTFSCTHTHKTRCCEIKSFKCPTIVDKEHPICRHIIKSKCSDSLDDIICTEKCEIRLDCGHQCKMGCHVETDPDHDLYKCLERCERTPKNCSLSHSCKKRCHESCASCNELVTRSLPCGHKKKNCPCGKPLENIKCYEKCKKEQSCAHLCPKKCCEPCVCNVIVEKTIPECLHVIQMECGVPATPSVCTANCAKTLDCGHPCLNKCHEECSTVCLERIPSKKRCPRNHIIMLHCSTVGVALDAINEEEEEYISHQCTEVCGIELSCGHICKGQCGQCYNGRLHVACRERCDKSLICGHVCKSPCSNVCPPCQANCELKCSHSSCKKKCGILCINCKEKCKRRCAHRKCSKKCDEPCHISGCIKPCTKKLSCGHSCIGFCGEPCPKLCRICDKEEVTQIFFGNEDEAKARFVVLEDCQHVFESEGIEHWISEFNAEIGIKKCPKCSKPIYNTKRFQKYILEALEDVKKVKRKFFTVNTYVNTDLIQTLKLVMDWKDEVKNLLQKLGLDSDFKRKWIKPRICDSEFSFYCFQVSFLKMASDTKRNMNKNNQLTLHLKTNLNKLVERVFDTYNCISNQMRDEVVCELRRIQVLGSVTLLKKNSSNESVKPILLKINEVMNPSKKFSSESEKTVVAYMKEAKKFFPLVITEEERKMIVSAMGFKQGHWYKCPNGHVYTIGDCGGAMETSTCPDCKATIGGMQHRLHRGNILASEMDGATRSAWPGTN